MNHIRGFGDLGKTDAALAGGKGASLGEMTNASIPVPPGFVILAQAFDAFLEATDIKADIEAILMKTHHDVMHEVEHASEEIQDIILSRELPEVLRDDILSSFKNLDVEFVAVRSSATAEDGADHAWAGQLDTFLNTTEEHLLENVKKCWASLFTPRAIFYRFEKGLAATHISVAVVVQKMIDSEHSGIAFSVHPVNEDRNQMIIEAGFGLGEAIVSGQVTPDSYVVTKSPQSIIDINVSDQSRALYRMLGGGNEWKELGEKGAKQVLTQQQILELGDLIVKIENHYGFPCDIEWAYEGGKFYITQSRPITTLSGVAVNESEPPIVLEKSFTRERPLFYYYAFPDADKAGIQKYLGRDIDDILFIIQPKGMPGEVWYPQKAFEDLSSLALERLNSDADLRARIARDLDMAWEQISPYFLEGKEIETKEEAFVYYQYVIDFWMALNTLFFCLVDNPNLNKEFSEKLKSVRDGTQEYTALMSEKFVIYFEKAFPEYAHVSHYITPKEVRDLERNDSQLMTILEERSRMGCFVYRDVLYLLPELDEVAEKNNLLLKQEAADSATEVKGQTAFKGKVRGLVKVVRRRADLEKVKEGDILVSPITDANYVPAMQRSAAFVTDEGGVMCHAAIVARELKKPCIIGTKVATQVLKDGDLVEVDADTGVVRILQTTELLFKKYAAWSKNWEAEFSLLADDVGLKAYTVFATEFGVSLSPLIIHKQGVTSCYYADSELEFFTKKIWEMYIADKKVLDIWISKAKTSFDVLTELIKEPDAMSVFEQFSACVDAFGAPNFALREVTNPLEATGDKGELEKVTEYRKYTELFYFNTDVYLQKILATVVLKSSYKKEYVQSLTLLELSAYINSGILPKEEMLKKRYEKSAAWYVSGVFTYYNGDIDEAISWLQGRYDGSGSFKGVKAYGGKVQGRVKKITSYDSFTTISEDEILVTGMTDPRFIHLMHTAKAFITDAGGMLSHAAIVARELKKPCIVGTKVATQVLKDGDLVEVDADNGVVKILV
jgi:phosphoenolpyruvate synthase/pyruvate phosphate dikinase